MPLLRLLFFAFALVAAGSARGAELNIFAAASLSDALREIGRAYQAATGDTLNFSFGASSTLALQIKQGAPADVFFSADELKMDELANAKLLAEGTRRSLLSNTLVIVVNAQGGPAISAAADLAKPGIRRVAVAEPQTVPAGIYAKEYLQQAGLWTLVSKKILPTENVRACLAAVESGNVDAGIVYKTDALISKRVKTAFEISVNEGPKISYPIAVMKDARQGEAAKRFVTYLAGREAGAVFARFGFMPAR